MSDAIRARIDWSTAEIDDGKLSVAVEGDTPKSWAKRFAGVSALLDANSIGWSKIALHNKTITVAGVQPGSEDDLRHLLESAVLQANADFGPREGAPEADPQSEQEREMTDTFRSFSQPSPGE